MTAFEIILRDAIGLDPAAIGGAAVEHAVRERQRACGLGGADYLDLVRRDSIELQALIDAVIVPDTWFFREPEAFERLAAFVTGAWLPAHQDGTLRLLSLPASTGEEPYSIAITLLDAGVPADRFRVDGVDVSLRLLDHAVNGVYGRDSFRDADAVPGRRYFVDAAHGRRVADEVRQQVQFRRGNIFAQGSIAGLGVYHVIFCRNLLIYFDRPTQDRALDVIERLLTPDGLLFVAPSETSLLLGRASGWTTPPDGCEFRRRSASYQGRDGNQQSGLDAGAA